MIEHGITTTEATWWFFLCPLHGCRFMGGVKRGLYAMKVSEFLTSSSKYEILDAKSKDGRVTGRGHVVPMPNELIKFVSDRFVPPEPEWVSLTDREAGMEGEDMVRWMLLAGRARPIADTIVASPRSHHYDFMLWPSRDKAEAKCDRRAADTGRIFVQTHELYHNPLIDRDGQFRDSKIY